MGPQPLYIFYSFTAGIDFRRQNLTSTDVRFWRLKSVSHWKSQCQLYNCYFIAQFVSLWVAYWPHLTYFLFDQRESLDIVLVLDVPCSWPCLCVADVDMIGWRWPLLKVTFLGQIVDIVTVLIDNVATGVSGWGYWGRWPQVNGLTSGLWQITPIRTKDTLPMSAFLMVSTKGNGCVNVIRIILPRLWGTGNDLTLAAWDRLYTSESCRLQILTYIDGQRTERVNIYNGRRPT